MRVSERNLKDMKRGNDRRKILHNVCRPSLTPVPLKRYKLRFIGEGASPFSPFVFRTKREGLLLGPAIDFLTLENGALGEVFFVRGLEGATNGLLLCAGSD